MLSVLFFNEFSDTDLADRFQILLHTHFVVGSIPFVHTIDLFTRKLVTFKTKDGIALGAMINA